MITLAGTLLGDRTKMNTNRLDHINNYKKSILTLYLTSGYPDFNSSIEIAQILINSNIDILEIGIPFSDPIADGPTIQNTSFKAIESKNKNNTKPIIDSTFEIVKTLRKTDMKKPILIMSYLNPIYQFGITKFSENAMKAGVDGIVIPDLPFEQSKKINQILNNNNVYLINMLTPATSKAKIKEVTQNSKGFIYYVSSTGVTGSRDKLSSKNLEIIDIIKQTSSIPVLVGFGVSTNEHIKIIDKYADGAIIASALINKLSPIIENKNKNDNIKTIINNFINNLRK